MLRFPPEPPDWMSVTCLTWAGFASLTERATLLVNPPQSSRANSMSDQYVAVFPSKVSGSLLSNEFAKERSSGLSRVTESMAGGAVGAVGAADADAVVSWLAVGCWLGWL